MGYCKNFWIQAIDDSFDQRLRPTLTRFKENFGISSTGPCEKKIVNWNTWNEKQCPRVINNEFPELKGNLPGTNGHDSEVQFAVRGRPGCFLHQGSPSWKTASARTATARKIGVQILPATFNQSIEQLPKEKESGIVVAPRDYLRTEAVDTLFQLWSCGNDPLNSAGEFLKETTGTGAEFFLEIIAGQFFLRSRDSGPPQKNDPPRLEQMLIESGACSSQTSPQQVTVLFFYVFETDNLRSGTIWRTPVSIFPSYGLPCKIVMIPWNMNKQS